MTPSVVVSMATHVPTGVVLGFVVACSIVILN